MNLIFITRSNFPIFSLKCLLQLILYKYLPSTLCYLQTSHNYSRSFIQLTLVCLMWHCPHPDSPRWMLSKKDHHEIQLPTAANNGIISFYGTAEYRKQGLALLIWSHFGRFFWIQVHKWLSLSKVAGLANIRYEIKKELKGRVHLRNEQKRVITPTMQFITKLYRREFYFYHQTRPKVDPYRPDGVWYALYDLWGEILCIWTNIPGS